MTRCLFRLIFLLLCYLPFTKANAEDPFRENIIATVGIRSLAGDKGHAYYDKNGQTIHAHLGNCPCNMQTTGCWFDLVMFKEGPILKSVQQEINSLKEIVQYQSKMIKDQSERIQDLERMLAY